MIEPEVIHNLLELALAVDCASNLRHRQFFDYALRPLAVVGDSARHSVGIASQQIALSPSTGSREVRSWRSIRPGRCHFHGRGRVRIVLWRFWVRRAGGGGFFRDALIRLWRPRILWEGRDAYVGASLLGLSLLHGLLLRLLRLRILRDKSRSGHPQGRVNVQARFHHSV